MTVEREQGRPPLFLRDHELRDRVTADGTHTQGLLHSPPQVWQRMVLQHPQHPDILARAFAAVFAFEPATQQRKALRQRPAPAAAAPDRVPRAWSPTAPGNAAAQSGPVLFPRSSGAAPPPAPDGKAPLRCRIPSPRSGDARKPPAPNSRCRQSAPARVNWRLSIAVGTLQRARPAVAERPHALPPAVAAWFLPCPASAAPDPPCSTDADPH